MEQIDKITRYKVAFAYRVASMIAEADDDVSTEEMVLLTEAFPRELLDGLGFVDDAAGFTDAYHEAILGALEVLPDHLPEDEKLGLITLFTRMVYADGALHPREAQLLLEAGEYLGLSRDKLSEHLRPLFPKDA